MGSGTRKKTGRTIPTMSDWPFGGHTSGVRGEHALWSAVITQALMDALSKSRSVEACYHKQEAIHWLTGNSKDFITVCLFAGFDPDYIRKKAKRAISNPNPWRAAPGEGKRYQERKKYRQQQKQQLPPLRTPQKHMEYV